MKRATKTVTWAAACCTLVGGFEGCDLQAKVDTIGTGRPVTYCHGETEGNVKVGQRFTRAECDAMLAAKLPRYWSEIEPCIHVPTSDNEKIAYTSTAYNIGSAGVCHSSMVKRLNAGDHAGACNALMVYDHAQGKVVRGLENRRVAERKICLTPDTATAPGMREAAMPKAAPESTWIKPVVVVVPVVVAKPAHWWSHLFSWAWWTEQ